MNIELRDGLLFTLDFTSFPYDDINGLLGLDLLLEGGFIIDLKNIQIIR